MSNRILVFYGSYRSDRTGIRLAEYVVDQLRRRGDDAELIDAKAMDMLNIGPGDRVLAVPR